MKKQLIRIFSLAALAFTGIAATSAFAAVTIISDDFSTNTLSKDGLAERDETGWQTRTTSDWNYGAGLTRFYNVGTKAVSANDTEGGFAQTVSLAGLGLTDESQLTVSFTYETLGGTSAADDLFVHVWGLVDLTSTATTGMANLSATAGNLWQPGDALFTTYSLGDGSVLSSSNNATASTAAISLVDMAVGITPTLYSTTLDLSGYALDTLAQYDYFLISFNRTYGGSEQGFALRDVAVTAIPEPGTYALLGGLLSLCCVMLRRRRA
tara:strand:- start:460 stop:1260 length:801 start_codon:yes stop_codon:yes gene_type:complete